MVCADQTDSDFDETNAQLVLKVARMYHTVCRLEQELAEARCTESIALVKLYKHWAEDAKKQHDYAEFDLGVARDMMTSNSNPMQLSVARRPNTKCPCLSSPSEHQHSSKCLVMTFNCFSY